MTKEDFAKLSMRKAVLAAYKAFKDQRITREKFDEYLKYWWQVNRHQTDIVNDINEVFGIE